MQMYLLNANVLVKAGAFSGAINGQLRTDEILSFQNELIKLYQTFSGSAKFSTMEGWLLFGIIGDGRGHFFCNGEIIDESGNRNALKFKLEFDQSFIPKILSSLEKIIKAFPVIENTFFGSYNRKNS